MIETVKFGDVFRHKEEDYVYLAQTDETLYAAKILNNFETKAVSDLYEKRARDPRNSNRIENHRLFCFVTLRTEDFKGRAASLGKTDNPEINIDILKSSLNKEDLKGIYEIIVNPASPVPRLLKELVADIQL